MRYQIGFYKILLEMGHGEHLDGSVSQASNLAGAPGWLSQLSIRLRLRSWSHGSWVRAPCRALCWQLGAWSLLRMLCLPLSLPLTHSCSVSLYFKNKHLKNFLKIRNGTWWACYFQHGLLIVKPAIRPDKCCIYFTDLGVLRPIHLMYYIY